MSAAVTTTNNSTPTPATQMTVTTNNLTYRLPSATTLQSASKLAIVDDRPVLLDYWTASLDKNACIGVREATKEKLLVKSAEEYTSPISKLYKSGTDYIIVTENSIYLVAGDIPTRKIS